MIPDQNCDALVPAAKTSLRRNILAARAARSPAARHLAGIALARTLEQLVRSRDRLPALAAVYLSVGTEPETAPMLASLHGLGVRLLVPSLRPDADLDWAPYEPGQPLRAGLRATIEPAATPDLSHSIADAELLLVPALAVDWRGHRLGRGGGSYDRALRHVSHDRDIFAVLYDEELLNDVPVAAHDLPVTGAITPTDWWRCSSGESITD